MTKFMSQYFQGKGGGGRELYCLKAMLQNVTSFGRFLDTVGPFGAALQRKSTMDIIQPKTMIMR